MDGDEVVLLKNQLIDRREKLEKAIPVSGNAEGLIELLQEVDRAIDKIGKGTYGRCETCNDTIEKDRLAVDPLLRFCLDHLSTTEQRFLERDISLASAVQSHLLPKQGLRANSWTTAHFYDPAGPVSGDYFDLIVPDGAEQNTSLYFSIGDISGKGIAASILMAHLHAILRSLIKADKQVNTVVEHANRLFSESTAQKNFATLAFGRTGADGRVELCNAAHCTPIIIRRTGIEKAPTAGFPLGLFAHGTYTSWSGRLEKGEAIVLYTDGLIEARNDRNELYGEERLVSLLDRRRNTTPSELIDLCLVDLAAFTNGKKRADDLTIVVLQYA